MRAGLLVAAAIASLGLGACESGGEPETQVGLTRGDGDAGDPAPAAADSPDLPAPEAQGATPMEERVATLGLLNKRNNVSQELELKPGETFEDGPLIVRLSACERTAPYEFPEETGAFVQVDVLERGDNDHTRVFSGWLFKQSPSLNVVEHPIYDVWIKDCAMSFPGEE